MQKRELSFNASQTTHKANDHGWYSRKGKENMHQGLSVMLFFRGSILEQLPTMKALNVCHVFFYPFLVTEDPKDRPMSLLEFLGNEKMVEMSEGADLDTELMEKMEKLQIYAKSPQKRAGESGTETNGHSSPVSSAVSSSDAGTAEAEDEKPQKALPPKPWLQKKKVKKQNKDPFVVNFPQLEEKPEEHSQAAEDLEGTVSDVKTVENTLEDQVFQGNEEGKPQSPQNEGPSAEEEQTLEEAEDGMGFSDEDFKPADEGQNTFTSILFHDSMHLGL